MKISDFLRLKISSENKQFEAIKNIRFYDDKNLLLVGKGTSSVHSFCEAFFDYVYRNYSSARGAEKLVKSNRKKYTKLSGSESMLLIQRILGEICEEYAITNYNITCEVENGNVKKAPAAQNVAGTQKKIAAETEKKVVSAEKNSQIPAVKSENQVQAAQGQKSSGEETVKLKTLSSELQRMQTADKDSQSQGTEQADTKPDTKPAADYAGLEDAYVHPIVKDVASNEAKQNNVVDSANKGMSSSREDPGSVQINVPVSKDISGLSDNTESAQINVPAGRDISGLSEKTGSAQINVPADKDISGLSENPGNAQINVPADKVISSSFGNSGSTQTNAPSDSKKDNQGKTGPEQHQKLKDKKNGKKQGIQDPRMKPGKGYKPFKPSENFKEASKFQKSEENSKKSNLNIDEIPCIAVIEEIKVPTMEEVPFIGIPEDNSVPSVEAVPYVGVEENASGKDISEIPYVGIEDGEAGKPIPDVPYLGAEIGEAGMPIPDVPFIGAGDFYAPDESETDKNRQTDDRSVQNVYYEQADFASQVEQDAGNEDNTDYREDFRVEKQGEQESQSDQADYRLTQSEPETRAGQAAQSLQAAQTMQAAQAEQARMAEQAAQAVQAAQARMAEQAAQAVQIAQAEQARQAEQAAQSVQSVHVPQADGPVQPAQSKRRTTGKPIIAKDIRQVVASAIMKNKQVVFSGPSATGKTYQVRKYARRNTKGYDGYKFVQFHPSFEYSDFIEGLRPVNIVNTPNATNVRIDGVFKAFCRMIVEDNLEHAVKGFSTLYAEKKQKVVQEFFEKIRDKKEALEDGTEYKDFDLDSPEHIFEHGVRDYYFIIDEINRANIAAVFGDVQFALDEDYRGIENRFDTRLGNLKTYRIIRADDIGKSNYSSTNIGFAEQMKFDCFERGFFIPHNLHIIATMNELNNPGRTMDAAIRQKFRWVNIKPAEIMRSSLKEILKDKNIEWIDQFASNLNLVNNLISEGLSDEYCLGPAFFRKLEAYPESIDEVFEADVEPVLKEYLAGKPDDIYEMFVSQCRKALKIGI